MTITSVTLETVLHQARRLPLSDQARLTAILEGERAARLIQALDEWAEDETGYEDEAWPELKTNLDEDRRRLSMQELFE